MLVLIFVLKFLNSELGDVYVDDHVTNGATDIVEDVHDVQDIHAHTGSQVPSAVPPIAPASGSEPCPLPVTG